MESWKYVGSKAATWLYKEKNTFISTKTHLLSGEPKISEHYEIHLT